MSVIVSVEPTTYPVTLAEVKEHLVCVNSDDDNYISQILIPAATSWVENYIQRALITRTYVEKVRTFEDGHCFRFPPLQTITSITYIDTDGVSQTLSTSVYDVDINDTPGRYYLAYGQSFPSVRQVENAVTITYTAGYNEVPSPIISAILLLIGHLYENRESTLIGITADELPFGTKELLNFYRFKNMV